MKKKEPKKIREITLPRPAIAANHVTITGCGMDMKLCFHQSVHGIDAGAEAVSFLRCVAHVSLSPATAKEVHALLGKTIQYHESRLGVIKAKFSPLQLEERIRKGAVGKYEEKGE